MEFLSPDFLSLLTGSATGFLFKAMAERRAQDQERFKMAMGVAKKENEHADAAVGRVSIDAGKLVRRFIVLCIMFGTIIAPFIIAYSDGVTTVVEHESTVYKPWDLLGLFGTDTGVDLQKTLSPRLVFLAVLVVGFLIWFEFLRKPR